MRKILTLLLIFVSLNIVASNSPDTPESGLFGHVVDSLTKAPLPGVVLVLTAHQDTLYTLSDTTGRFTFDGLIRETDYNMLALMNGYRLEARKVRYSIDPLDVGVVRMLPEAEQIKAAVVREKAEIISFRGDTVVYNTNLVKVMDGSEAIEIIRKLPGIEVTDNGYVTHLGNLIESTFVDNRLVFGIDPRDALNNLSASDVESVEVFEVKKMGKNPSQRKVKVMNIVTKSKLDWQQNLFALASYGSDTDKGMTGEKPHPRYAVGTEANFFSDRRKFKTNVLFENANMRTARIDKMFDRPVQPIAYTRNLNAEVSYDQRVGKLWRIAGNYSFSQRFVQNRSIQQQIYSSGEREYTDTSTSSSLVNEHNVGVEFGNTAYSSFSKYQRWGFNQAVNFRYFDKDVDSRQYSVNKISSEEFTVNPVTRRNNAGWNINGMGSLRHTPKKSENYTQLHWDFNISEDESDGVRLDTLSSSTRYTDYKLNGGGKDRTFNLIALQHLRITDDFSSTIKYDFNYSKGAYSSIVFDNYLMQIDSTQSEIHSENYITNKLGFEMNYFALIHFGIGAAFQASVLNRNEDIPLANISSKTFYGVLPSAVLEFDAFDGLLSFSSKYNSSLQLPSIEQVRSFVNTSNPLWLVGGNPQLKSGIVHNLEIVSRLMTGIGLLCDLTVLGDYKNRPIVSRNLYFTENTPLPQYGGYEAVKGATLSTYTNAPMSANISARLNLSKSFAAILRLGTGLAYSYSRNPDYVGDALVYTAGHVPSLNISATTMFSRKFDLTVKSTSSFGKVSNDMDFRSDYFKENLNVKMKFSFLKRCSMNVNYNFDYYRNFNGLVADQQNHLLNIVLGVAFGRNNSCFISLSGYDLLASNERFSSSMKSDYVLNKWTDIPSRNIMLNFSYKFNSKGKK